MYLHYGFWLALISILCFSAERIIPWRKGQQAFRLEFGQDIFWLIFNGYLLAIVFGPGYKLINGSLDHLFRTVFKVLPTSLDLFAEASLGMQIIVLIVSADFIEWCVHNGLHRIKWLWKFHRVHHSIVTMDWIGNFRFHWFEPILYNTVKYLPLALLGVHPQALLIVAVFSTLIGHLNHSNLNLSWGPLRYLFNSPRMHIWHHEKEIRAKAGVNFAIVFSLWDWLFRTAYLPGEPLQPESLGFSGQEKVSAALLARFFIPFYDQKRVSNSQDSSLPGGAE